MSVTPDLGPKCLQRLSADAKSHPSKIGVKAVVVSEFSETPNQAYFYANFWFCTRTFPAGDSNLRQFFFC